jgi:TolA-binding protein
LAVAVARGQTPADQAAEALFQSAVKTAQGKNYPLAAAHFKDYLAKYPKHKRAPAARYGLALALLHGPTTDYAGAAGQLEQVAADATFPERAFVLYYLGAAKRGLGLKEPAQRRAAAHKYFAQAAGHFGKAAKAFRARVKAVDARAKDLPLDLEWAARSLCDRAEMLLRQGKAKEAQSAAALFLKDKTWRKSRYRGLGLYYHGFASFLRKDYLAAGRSLNQLTPFANTVYATHARYLLARTHHLQDELAEAGEHYEGVLTDYARFKQEAVLALQQPDKLKNDPEEKARLEALVKDPAPEHVARAAFFSGELLYEAGKFSDALARFATFPQQYAGSSLLIDARFRQGLCQVQLKQFGDALKTLGPLADKEPRFADRALLWMGRARAGEANPANPQAYAQSLKAAMDTFRAAAEKARQAADKDPEAKGRRGECLLELGDTQQLAREFKGAAVTYGRILKEELLPRREPELFERQAAAYHLAGDYSASDKVCVRFRETHPNSPLLASVLFRHAENAYFAARAAGKDPKMPDRVKTEAALTVAAVKRYQEVIDKFPEFAHAPQARYTVGQIFYHKGEFVKAKKALEAIDAADRKDDLVLTPYLLADCLIRLAPAKAEDALAAGKIQEQLQAAVELLDGFTGSQPKGEQTPDALLKLGMCHQRLAALLVKPEERNKVLTDARTTYEKLINQFPKHPFQPQAIFERAKCLALVGDKNGAMNEFRRFANDNVLKAATVAPLGLLELAILLREQNKAAEAAKVLEDCHKQHEPALKKDATRSGWVVLLQYQHGVALREAGKFTDARAVFDALIKDFPKRPEAAEAALRRGQCLKDEALLQIGAARQKLGQVNAKPEELAAARKKHEEGLETLREAVDYLVGQAKRLKEEHPKREVRARMLYDAAWGYRALAEPEIAAAQANAQKELLKKRAGNQGRKKKPAAVTALPEIPLKDIKLQPAEEKARAQYKALIQDEAFAELPLAVRARLELAEIYAQRAEHDAAVTLLEEAIDKEPPADLTEAIRLRLGACLAAKKDFKGALAQFEAVAQNPKSPLLAQAHYRAGECLFALKDYAGAAKRLALFRDQQPFQNLPGLTDRALLRLGHALAQLKQWDQSRQAHEQVAGRFSTGPWVHEARFGIAFAIQGKAATANNKQEYDNAINYYTQVTAATAAEVAARAQYQIGLCRLAQERYAEAATAFLVVPYTYDYPEWTAAALCEAARALVEDKKEKKIAKAEKLLRRVIRDHPKSAWAKVARKRLDGLKKD